MAGIPVVTVQGGTPVIPSFVGEPVRVAISGSIDALGGSGPGQPRGAVRALHQPADRRNPDEDREQEPVNRGTGKSFVGANSVRWRT